MALKLHHRRTVQIVHFLRAANATTPRRRFPRQLQPDAIRREYYRAIVPLGVTPVQEIFSHVRPEILRQLVERHDAPGDPDDLVKRAAERAANAYRPDEVHDVAMKFGRRTSAFQKDQLDRQVRAALGVPLTMIDRSNVDLLPEFARTNVELIKTVSDRYFDRIADAVSEAFAKGSQPEVLAAQLVDIDDMSENDAMRIARDQIGKLNGDFNRERQDAMGVTGYIWRGTMDNRERDEHREREGVHFEWDSPPEDGHPGEPVQCRCYAEPDFTPILEEPG